MKTDRPPFGGLGAKLPSMESGKARQKDRKRKLVTVTLGDEARAKLKRLAETRGVPMSVLIETLIMEAK